MGLLTHRDVTRIDASDRTRIDLNTGYAWDSVVLYFTHDGCVSSCHRGSRTVLLEISSQSTGTN